MYWNHMGSWTMVGAWAFFALLLVGVVLLAVVLVRLLAGGDRDRQPGVRGPDRSRAREILDERYARGEIDATEYDERRRRLEGAPES